MTSVFTYSWLNQLMRRMAVLDASFDMTCRQIHCNWKLETYKILATDLLHPSIFVRLVLGQLHSDMKNPEEMWAYKVKLLPLVNDLTASKLATATDSSSQEARYTKSVCCLLAWLILALPRWFGIALSVEPANADIPSSKLGALAMTPEKPFISTNQRITNSTGRL